LIDWTEEGVRNFKDTVDRYEGARGQLEGLGVRFKEIYWTLGVHDIVSVIEAPDDETLPGSSPSPVRAPSERPLCARSMRTR
jgi:uncharacterized protein with GYD domain